MGCSGWQARWIVRVAWIAACALLGVTQVARAQAAPAAPVEEIARGHYALGRALYDAGRFDDAAHEFSAAYEAAPRDQLLYNLYLTYRDGGHMAEAADALRRYVVTLEEGPTKVQLGARLAALERMLATPGQTHEGEGATENTDAVETVDPGQVPDHGTPTPPQPSDLPTTEPRPESSPARPAPLAAMHAEPLEERTSSPSPAPWVVVGAGAGMVLASAVVGGFALKAQGDLESICPNREACTPGIWQSTRDRGRRLAVSADVLWASGAAIGVAGLLWLLLRRPVEHDGVTASCTSRGCALGLRGSF